MIKLENVHKSFGKNEVLKGINLHIEQGQVVVIIGPSGSGKSTLFKLLIGLQECPEQSIYFGNQDLAAVSLSKLRNSIAYVPTKF